MLASQKFGIDRPSSPTTRTNESTPVERLTDETTPSGTARQSDSTIAIAVNW